ncbi:MAG: hypothetical protein H6595_01895 [Flavobacteriales bacterium]|nr:hypothetical protein [Flavobacteriales bacterium]MCB9166214.1 hypothetical protein [Flavobacteriales bacterium]
MDLLPHTVAWCKGEIFEGRVILVVGCLVAIAAIGFWKFGGTPFARAAVVPVGVLALLLIGTGVIMPMNNARRITAYTVAHAADPGTFARAEQARTEAFISWYPRTRWIFFGVAIGGMLLLMSGPAIAKSIGMVLLALALSVFVIDHFSEERALIYQRHIQEKSADRSIP